MVTLIGERETAQRLDKLAVFEKEIERALPRFGREVAKAFSLKPYPAPTGGGYVRTFDLKGSFESKPTGRMQVTITNDANERGRYYAGFVLQKGQQVPIHRGRWWTAETEAQPLIDDFNKALGERAKEIWEGGL